MVGLVEEAVERYGIGQLWVEDVTIVAVLGRRRREAARELLVGSVLQMDEERLDLLGGDDVSLGLRIWRRAGDASMECAVEPMHSEPSKVYIRLVQSPGRADARRPRLREAADAVHGFLLGPLTSFIAGHALRQLSRRDPLLTIAEVLRRSTAYLAERGSPSPRLDAELLLAHALGVERIDLYTDSERPLTPAELAPRPRAGRPPRPPGAGRLPHRRAGVPPAAAARWARACWCRGPRPRLLVEWALGLCPRAATVL